MRRRALGYLRCLVQRPKAFAVLHIRLAFSAAALIALGGTTWSAVHAEETALPLAAAEIAASASTQLPHFTPSAEVVPDAGFAAVPQALTAQDLAVAPIEPVEPVQDDLGEGVASYYGKRFAGRPTASGETFNPAQFTAAHRTLPFGSRVRVTNPGTGESVVVRINDRGPYHGARVIDLSRAAAERIGIVRAGHGTVELELLANS